MTRSKNGDHFLWLTTPKNGGLGTCFMYTFTGCEVARAKKIFLIFSDTLVDSEDDRADNLVVGLFVKRARGEEAAEERQAESRGEETEAE